jgi:hypothetical protein
MILSDQETRELLAFAWTLFDKPLWEARQMMQDYAQEHWIISSTDMLNMVVGSLRGYPNAGGDIEVMKEVERIVREAVEEERKQQN